MWGGHSWVRLLNYVHLRWNSSHLPYWTGGRLEKLFKEVSWNSVRKMNGKMVCAALHYLYTGSVPYFSMFKETNKEGKWRKKDRSHSLLWWGRIKKDQASKSIRKQWISDLGSDSDPFCSDTNKLNQILKKGGEWLSGSLVTKAGSGLISFVYKCIFTLCASKWKPVPRLLLSFREERATQRGKQDNRVHSTGAWAASQGWTETWHLALSKSCLCTGAEGRFRVTLNICCPAHPGETLVSSHFVLVES